jgi:glutathione S-transferase
MYIYIYIHIQIYIYVHIHIYLGTEMSLVDVMFTPFLERMAASLPYYKGFIVRDKKYPNLLRWFEAMDERPSYQGVCTYMNLY